jgi:maltooligosyltrehalose trehalohydrolase
VAVTGRRDAYYYDYLGSPQEFVSTAKRGFLFQGQYYRWQKQSRGAPMQRHASRCIAYLQNHDQVANSLCGRRLHQIATPAQCRALTALLLLAPQTPLLFMGQEFHASSPFLYFADHQEPLRTQVRAGRAEFLSQFPGAASPDGRRALDDPGDRNTFERSKLDWRECQEDNAALHLHRDLLALRRDDAVIRGQGRHGFDGAVLGERAFVLRWFHGVEGDRILIVNLGDDIRQRPMPEPLLAPPQGMIWQRLWSSEHARYGGAGAVDPDPEHGWLLPGQCAMLLIATPGVKQ